MLVIIHSKNHVYAHYLHDVCTDVKLVTLVMYF